MLAGAPNEAQWFGMSAAAKKEAVVDLAVAALDECVAAGQALDVWEAHCLRAALGALYINFFAAAWTDVIMAMAPPGERAPGWEQRLAGELPTAQQLRHAFEVVRHKPVPAE